MPKSLSYLQKHIAIFAVYFWIIKNRSFHYQPKYNTPFSNFDLVLGVLSILSIFHRKLTSLLDYSIMTTYKNIDLWLSQVTIVTITNHKVCFCHLGREIYQWVSVIIKNIALIIWVDGFLYHTTKYVNCTYLCPSVIELSCRI